MNFSVLSQMFLVAARLLCPACAEITQRRGACARRLESRFKDEVMMFSNGRVHRLATHAFLLVPLSGVFLMGCGAEPKTANTTTKSTIGEKSHDDHVHAHGEEGPHHGQLVELGNEEYHAEVVHDDQAGSVTIYLLDGSAKNAVPIEATEVTINLSHAGKAEQFPLAAQPDVNDPAGKSSRFVSLEKHLAQDLDGAGRNPKLVVTIQGKQYSGKIEHEHSHNNGGHKH